MPASPSSDPRAEPNRLIHETSPYLQQHAYNPVDWYPWNEEALQRAHQTDSPIFLSIGYSACHWCHVMEHESFENPDIANLMNEKFVNIKVDREERPDLDQIYMNAVLALTGRGGWPMSVFLTPDLKPFYGGTYWPPESRMGMPGFRDVLLRVREAWDQRRDDVNRGADELTAAVVQMGQVSGEQTQLTNALLENAARALLRSADRRHGGFGSAPKFPHPMDLRVLLRVWKRFGNDEALAVLRQTADKMARGGIYDQLGGGFHRYSTDAHWLAPHFEKMLYDNALLTSVYVELFQVTGDPAHAQVVRETLDYVLREMTQPNGGFYSTQDADSEGEEGKFFVWADQEIVEALGPEEARIFNHCYDVSSSGNWEGKNILNRPVPHSEAAKHFGMSDEELSEQLKRCRDRLFDVRRQRIAPGRDDKVLVSWNGLMMAAMAQGAQVLREPRYAEAAQQAADFILSTMRTKDGRLLHSYKDGRARFPAYLDDYACLIDGLIEVYHSSFDPQYLEAAVELAERMIADFHDPADGGFFYTSSNHESLIARNKDSQDNATPSGNGMAAYALLRLGRLTGRTDFDDKAVATLEMLSGQMAQVPMASGQSLLAVDFLLGGAFELVIVDGARLEETEELLTALHARFLPNKVIARRTAEMPDDDLPTVLQPLLGGRSAIDNACTLYLCEYGTCELPVTGTAGLETVLEKSLG